MLNYSAISYAAIPFNASLRSHPQAAAVNHTHNFAVFSKNSNLIRLGCLLESGFFLVLMVVFPSLCKRGLRPVPLSLGVQCQLAHKARPQAQLLHNNDIIPERHPSVHAAVKARKCCSLTLKKAWRKNYTPCFCLKRFPL